MIFVDQLGLPENVYWAWDKVKRCYSVDRTWFDELELAEFDANLDSHVRQILKGFQERAYHLSPGRPVPFPKKRDESGPNPTRQMFWFTVRDQVAWMALLNVIGPALDSLMPSWSYGDRLYRSAWHDLDDEILRIGPYRHSRRQVYRPFRNSWPRYRRHIFLTVRAMSRSHRADPLEKPDEDVKAQEGQIASSLRVPYLNEAFWPEDNENVVWCGLDLKKFFPNTPVTLIASNILDGLRQADPSYHGELDGLIQHMLRFRLDCGGCNEKELYVEYGLSAEEQEVYTRLPTGLRAKEHRRTLLLLKEAIKRYPAKITLGFRALQFCRRTGLPELRSVLEAAADAANYNALTVTFVRAALTQNLGLQVFEAFRTCTDLMSPVEDRQAAVTFLLALPESLDYLHETSTGRWFERRAWAVLQGALAAVRCAVAQADPTVLSPSDAAQIKGSLTSPAACWDKTSVLPKAAWWHAATGHSTAVWAWWADERTSDRLSSYPGPIWQATAEKVAQPDPVADRLLEKHPGFISVPRLVDIAKGTSPSPSDNAGWFFDALYGRPRPLADSERQRLVKATTAAPTNQCAPRLIAAGLACGTRRRGLFRLDEWTAWQRKYLQSSHNDRDYVDRAADPRLSEWTTLSLVLQLARHLCPRAIADRPPIHPANFYVPSQWTRLSAPLSWEQWRAEIEDNVLVCGDHAIWDRRYMGDWDESLRPLLRDFPWIQGLGLLVLGLLRRDFTWPALWNPQVQRQVKTALAQQLVESLPCSSLSMALVEGCLLPQAVERFFLGDLMQDYEAVDDVAHDPPHFSDLPALARFIEMAKTHLRQHQLAGHGGHSRQLVPLSLRQLTRPEWHTAVPAQGGAVDEGGSEQ